VTCGFCRQEFTVEEAERGCQSCPLQGCGLVRCPRCGYEMPPEPVWLQRLLGGRRGTGVSPVKGPPVHERDARATGQLKEA
jgi:hypothetical protein